MDNLYQLELFDLQAYQSEQGVRDWAKVTWVREKLQKIEYEQLELSLFLKDSHEEFSSGNLKQAA
jgi:hypothetical protein